jgi:hypothetical protein
MEKNMLVLIPTRTSDGWDYREKTKNEGQLGTLLGMVRFNDSYDNKTDHLRWIAIPHEGAIARSSLSKYFYCLEAAEYYLLAMAIEYKYFLEKKGIGV